MHRIPALFNFAPGSTSVDRSSPTHAALLQLVATAQLLPVDPVGEHGALACGCYLVCV